MSRKNGTKYDVSAIMQTKQILTKSLSSHYESKINDMKKFQDHEENMLESELRNKTKEWEALSLDFKHINQHVIETASAREKAQMKLQEITKTVKDKAEEQDFKTRLIELSSSELITLKESIINEASRKHLIESQLKSVSAELDLESKKIQKILKEKDNELKDCESSVINLKKLLAHSQQDQERLWKMDTDNVAMNKSSSINYKQQVEVIVENNSKLYNANVVKEKEIENIQDQVRKLNYEVENDAEFFKIKKQELEEEIKIDTASLDEQSNLKTELEHEKFNAQNYLMNFQREIQDQKSMLMNNVEGYKSQIYQLEMSIQSENIKIENTNKQTQEMKDKNHKLKEEFEIQKTDLQKQFNKVNDDIFEMNKKKNDHVFKFDSSQVKIQKLERDNVNIEDKMEGVKMNSQKQLESLKHSISNLELNLSDNLQRIDLSKANRHKLNESIQDLESKLNIECAKMQDQRDQLSQDYLMMKSDYKNLKTRSQMNSQDKNKLEYELSNLKNDHTYQVENIKYVEEALRLLIQKNTIENDKLAETVYETTETLEAQIDLSKNIHIMLEDEHIKSDDRLINLEQTNKNIGDEIMEQKDGIFELQNQISKMQGLYEKEVKQFQESVEEIQRVKNRIEDKALEYTQTIQNLKKEANRVEACIHMENVVKNLQNTRDSNIGTLKDDKFLSLKRDVERSRNNIEQDEFLERDKQNRQSKDKSQYNQARGIDYKTSLRNSKELLSDSRKSAENFNERIELNESKGSDPYQNRFDENRKSNQYINLNDSNNAFDKDKVQEFKKSREYVSISDLRKSKESRKLDQSQDTQKDNNTKINTLNNKNYDLKSQETQDLTFRSPQNPHNDTIDMLQNRHFSSNKNKSAHSSPEKKYSFKPSAGTKLSDMRHSIGEKHSSPERPNLSHSNEKLLNKMSSEKKRSGQKDKDKKMKIQNLLNELQQNLLECDDDTDILKDLMMVKRKVVRKM